MAHGQLKYQFGAWKGGSFIDETTDIYFIHNMSQVLNLEKIDIFTCHLYFLTIIFSVLSTCYLI